MLALFVITRDKAQGLTVVYNRLLLSPHATETFNEASNEFGVGCYGHEPSVGHGLSSIQR
jgi:hypothetical protein